MEIRLAIKEAGSGDIGFGSNLRLYKGKSLMVALSDFVSLDIETTGLSTLYDEIIELAAVKYRDGKSVGTFSSLVKPINPVSDFVTQLTGITNTMLQDAPSLSEILPVFLNFVGADIVVGHNINFDINFIYDACESLGLTPFSNDFVDTMRIARRMYKNLPNHKLDTLIDYFDLNHREIHRGLSDCELTANCFQAMIADIDAFEEATKIKRGKYRRKIHSLKELIATEKSENPDSPLYGKVCVFTGTLENFTRKEAAQLVVNIGGIVGDSVTKKTNFLILGNNDYCQTIKNRKSNKQKKAEQLIAEGADLSIIPESVFLDILNEDCNSCEEPKDEEMMDTPNAGRIEREAFELVAPTLRERLVADNLSADSLSFKQSKTDNVQYSSVYLFNENSLLCRICFRGKQNYFSIPIKYKSLIPSGVEYKIQNSDSNYCRIPVESLSEFPNYLELLKKILELQVDAYTPDFGCCSRYEECSNAMKCIHPKPDMALRCAYRKNMKKGKIFYGKNKNI